MSIEFKIDVNNLEAFRTASMEAIIAALEEMGMQAENYAVLELERPKPHPDGSIRPNVDTGRLVGSIGHSVVDDHTVEIGTNVEYAVYVEKGTSKSQAYPYLEPAATQHGDEYRQILEDHLRNGE